jgi:hypothetical protein
MEIRKLLPVISFSLLFIALTATTQLQAASLSTHTEAQDITTTANESDSSTPNAVIPTSYNGAGSDAKTTTTDYTSENYNIDQAGAHTWDFSITDGESSVKDWVYTTE